MTDYSPPSGSEVNFDFAFADDLATSGDQADFFFVDIYSPNATKRIRRTSVSQSPTGLIGSPSIELQALGISPQGIRDDIVGGNSLDPDEEMFCASGAFHTSAPTANQTAFGTGTEISNYYRAVYPSTIGSTLAIGGIVDVYEEGLLKTITVNATPSFGSARSNAIVVNETPEIVSESILPPDVPFPSLDYYLRVYPASIGLGSAGQYPFVSNVLDVIHGIERIADVGGFGLFTSVINLDKCIKQEVDAWSAWRSALGENGWVGDRGLVENGDIEISVMSLAGVEYDPFPQHKVTAPDDVINGACANNLLLMGECEVSNENRTVEASAVEFYDFVGDCVVGTDQTIGYAAISLLRPTSEISQWPKVVEPTDFIFPVGLDSFAFGQTDAKTEILYVNPYQIPGSEIGTAWASYGTTIISGAAVHDYWYGCGDAVFVFDAVQYIKTGTIFDTIERNDANGIAYSCTHYGLDHIARNLVPEITLGIYEHDTGVGYPSLDLGNKHIKLPSLGLMTGLQQYDYLGQIAFQNRTIYPDRYSSDSWFYSQVPRGALVVNESVFENDVLGLPVRMTQPIQSNGYFGIPRLNVIQPAGIAPYNGLSGIEVWVGSITDAGGIGHPNYLWQGFPIVNGEQHVYPMSIRSDGLGKPDMQHLTIWAWFPLTVPDELADELAKAQENHPGFPFYPIGKTHEQPEYFGSHDISNLNREITLTRLVSPDPFVEFGEATVVSTLQYLYPDGTKFTKWGFPDIYGGYLNVEAFAIDNHDNVSSSEDPENTQVWLDTTIIAQDEEIRTLYMGRSSAENENRSIEDAGGIFGTQIVQLSQPIDEIPFFMPYVGEPVPIIPHGIAPVFSFDNDGNIFVSTDPQYVDGLGGINGLGLDEYYWGGLRRKRTTVEIDAIKPTYGIFDMYAFGNGASVTLEPPPPPPPVLLALRCPM